MKVNLVIKVHGWKHTATMQNFCYYGNTEWRHVTM